MTNSVAYLAFTSGVTDSRGDVFFDLQANSIPATLVPAAGPIAVALLAGTLLLLALWRKRGERPTGSANHF